MSLTKSTYSQAASLTYEDVTISPATLADGTLATRFDPLAFPQKEVKYAGYLGTILGAPTLTKGTVLHDPAVAIANLVVGAGGAAESDTVTITGSPTGGTWTLTYGGNTTAALAIGATNAQVQTALNALAGVAVTVTGSAGGPYTVTWNAVGVRTALTAADIFTAVGAFASGTYYWKLTAGDGFGEVVSNEVTATLTTNDAQPFTWAAVPGDGFHQTVYRLYRGTASNAETKLIATTTALTVTDTGAAGTTVTAPSATNKTGHAVPRAARTTHGAGS
jgi:hypothetical protein